MATQGVALPWWDWTVDAQVPAAYDTPVIDGAANPLYQTHAIVTSANPPIDKDTSRDPGGNPQARLPTPDAVDGILDIGGWAGGDMGDVTTAAYDPIFFAHHCMIDRVWSLWQDRNGNGNVPPELLDLPLQPFDKTFRDVLTVQSLG